MGKGDETTQVQQTVTHVNTSSSFNPSLVIGAASPVKADDGDRDSVRELLSLGNTPTGPSSTEPAKVEGPTLTKTTVLLMVAAGVIFYAKR